MKLDLVTSPFRNWQLQSCASRGDLLPSCKTSRHQTDPSAIDDRPHRDQYGRSRAPSIAVSVWQPNSRKRSNCCVSEFIQWTSSKTTRLFVHFAQPVNQQLRKFFNDSTCIAIHTLHSHRVLLRHGHVRLCKGIHFCCAVAYFLNAQNSPTLLQMARKRDGPHLEPHHNLHKTPTIQKLQAYFGFPPSIWSFLCPWSVSHVSGAKFNGFDLHHRIFQHRKHTLYVLTDSSWCLCL